VIFIENDTTSPNLDLSKFLADVSECNQPIQLETNP